MLINEPMLISIRHKLVTAGKPGHIVNYSVVSLVCTCLLSVRRKLVYWQ